MCLALFTGCIRETEQVRDEVRDGVGDGGEEGSGLPGLTPGLQGCHGGGTRDAGFGHAELGFINFLYTTHECGFNRWEFISPNPGFLFM